MSRFLFENSRGKDYKEVMNKEYTDKEYTPKDLVEDLLKIVPFEKEDFVLDAGSGFNKVWFNCIPTTQKDECEIDEGKDFYKYEKRVDWVIGNPPFPEFVGFLFKSAEICNKGFAFLINHSRINQLTPKRLDDLKSKGFYLSKIHIFGVKCWFGRYYFLVFTKNENLGITFSRINYGNAKSETLATPTFPTEKAINRNLKENPTDFPKPDSPTSLNSDIKRNLSFGSQARLSK